MIPSILHTYISPSSLREGLQLGLFFVSFALIIYLTRHTDDETRRDGEALGFDLIHFPASFFFFFFFYFPAIFLFLFFFFSLSRLAG